MFGIETILAQCKELFSAIPHLDGPTFMGAIKETFGEALRCLSCIEC
jgi:hypothetical protein